MGRSSDADDESRTYPGAQRPARSRRVAAGGLHLAVYEWGDADAPPLMLAHGGFDFAGTMDVFAPLLAAGGWRVVSWDQRGHGDSDRAAMYRWEADMRDALAVFADVADGPVPVVGHSKGGSLMTHVAAVRPHLVSAVVNIDGIPSGARMPDLQDHERTALLTREAETWLDHRRRVAGGQRKPGTLDEIATRRAAMNPRLDHEWLTYIATIGGYRSEDGWRWKIDPSMRMGGFGPWRPEWSLYRVAEVGHPFLAILATEPEVMGFGTGHDDVLPYVPPRGRVVEMDGAGHFVHIERPRETAELVLEHLDGVRSSTRGRPVPLSSPRQTAAPTPGDPTAPGVRRLVHNRIGLALHELRSGAGRPLLVMHGLGERSSLDLVPQAAGWPGPIFGLDFTGHGDSDLALGGGYACELLLGDADAAVADLGPVTVLGRGLGAYIGVLLAGSRAASVRGVVVVDGPGLAGGGDTPSTPHLDHLTQTVTPDPFALVELSDDVRPADYARHFAWAASTGSGLDTPISVSAVLRPPWLEDLAGQPGVAVVDAEAALAAYAAVD